MRASDIVVLSLRQVKERKLRSILTVLAIAVGVTSIIALSSQVEGVSQSITGELEKLGPDTVMVTVRGTILFTDADVMRLKELEGVSEVTPILGIRVSVTGIDDPVSLVGVASSDLVGLLGEVKLLDGSMYFDAAAPQALIGYSVAKDEIGQTRYEVGQPILVQIGRARMTDKIFCVSSWFFMFLGVFWFLGRFFIFLDTFQGYFRVCWGFC